MNYIKIKVKLLNYGENVYRTFWVNPYIPLENLAATIINTFHGSFCHMFAFIQDKKLYETDPAVDNINYYGGDRDTLRMSKYDLNDLFNNNKPLTLIYDFGDDYRFSIKKLKGEKEIIPEDDFDEELIYFIEGKGYGIFEDHIDLLEVVLSNEDATKYIRKYYECEPDELFFDFPLTREEYFEPLDKEEYEDLTMTGYGIYEMSLEYHDF